MSEELVYCTKVTLEDVYDKTVLTDIYGLDGMNSIIKLRSAIDTYKVVDFKPPTQDDWFVSIDGELLSDVRCLPLSPRLIVKRGRPVTRKVVTFTETGEVRQAKAGEWFLLGRGSFDRACHPHTYDRYPLYTRTESTSTSYEFD
jgi:hypothetical protein